MKKRVWPIVMVIFMMLVMFPVQAQAADLKNTARISQMPRVSVFQETESTLPYVAAYKAPVASEENYLEEFMVTQGSNVFYLLPNAGEKIWDVELLYELNDIATAEISPDGSYVTVTVDRNFTEQYYCFQIICERADGSKWLYLGEVYLLNGTPHIAFGWPGDGSTVSDDFYGFLDVAKGYFYEGWFYFLEGDTKTMLTCEDIVSSNESVVRIEDTGYGDGSVRMTICGWGEAEVVGNVNGTGYSMDVVSRLPLVGVYSSETASEESLIVDFTVTESNKTFYLIAEDGLAFESVNVTEDLAAIADIQANDEYNCVSVTITGTPSEDGMYGFEYSVYDEVGLSFWGYYYLEHIKSEIPEAAEKIVTTPMYRLYNPNSGEHFYTGSVEERDMLDEAGWTYEGVAWNAPVYEGDPVYRVFNPNSGDHHYTMSRDEVDMLVAAGWQYEGIAWNSAPEEHPEAIAQQRLYNPNADCGSHHYTSSDEELNTLVELGWIHEGIGWFGLLK